MDSEHSIYYCFSNVYINNIISYPYIFGGGDLAPYYVSFLRAVSTSKLQSLLTPGLLTSRRYLEGQKIPCCERRCSPLIFAKVPLWPTIDGPLGLCEEDALSYACKFYEFGFTLLPLLWAVNCFYFWPVLHHAHSFRRIRCSSPNHHDSSTAPVIWQDNIDPDNMTSEELLDLGDAVGTQSRGLPQELIDLLPTSKFKFGSLFKRNFFGKRMKALEQ
ncbi:hypothetical protein K1719_044287 [Acacia pycnantha]|nr:hypothetical protein K1719_044287 [Acacia pycnantha]